MIALALLAVLPLVDDNPEKDPREAKPGKVYQWKAEDGLPYEFHVPKDYDPDEGANLTLVLHGNGLDHRWTFWNHPAGEFRADDVVVSPDGTTLVEHMGTNEFLGNAKDAKRLRALIEELKTIWNVRQTFLYGHSQGSFFVFYYAGLYPEDVDGVCGHASGMWGQTQLAKKGHHQAIGLLHGTDDANVPYGQSWDTLRAYRDAKYPLANLRTLFDWPHAPHHFQAESVLSWCEGMTSTDPERVAACLEVLAQPKLKMGANWSGLWAVANRLATMEGATDKQKKRGAKVAAAVDELAAGHVAAIEKSLGKKGKLSELSKGPWVGCLIRFLEEFDGVPVHAAFLKEHKKAVEGLWKSSGKAYGDYRKKKDSDPKKAFAAGLELLTTGFVHYRVPQVSKAMEGWAKDKSVKLSKKDREAYEEAAEIFAEGREAGFKEFAKRNEKTKL